MNLEQQINKIFTIFYRSINPMINFSNKRERNAIEKLLTKLGFEKVKKATIYAISIQSQKYAPTITSPIQLLNKYGTLQAYYAKNEIKKGMNVIKL